MHLALTCENNLIETRNLRIVLITLQLCIFLFLNDINNRKLICHLGKKEIGDTSLFQQA